MTPKTARTRLDYNEVIQAIKEDITNRLCDLTDFIGDGTDHRQFAERYDEIKRLLEHFEKVRTSDPKLWASETNVADLVFLLGGNPNTLSIKRRDQMLYEQIITFAKSS